MERIHQFLGVGHQLVPSIGDNFGISGTQGGDLETSKFCHKNIYDQDADNKRPNDLGFRLG